MHLLKWAVAAILLTGITIPQATAQRRKAVEKKESVDISALLSEYRFSEAIENLQSEISKAQRQKKPTVTLEAQLNQARMGEEMLQGTEQVIFIDSMVVSRQAFLSAFKLSKECGRIDVLAKLAPSLVKEGKIGETAFLNDFGDRILFSATDKSGNLKLHAADKLGNRWGNPVLLEGMGGADEIQDYPFILTDGVTLYYAAQGENSLGGYDIFVTRKSTSTGNYVKAENIGMPFNSPANDYMMVIDETKGVGWFVSDRNQPADKVCIYRFIHNESRDVYNLSEDNEESVRRAARIASIAESQTDKKALSEARRKLSETEKQTYGNTVSTEIFHIVPGISYTSIQSFRNAGARKMAQEVVLLREELKNKDYMLSLMRKGYGTNRKESLKMDILKLEKEVGVLIRTLHEKEKAMRKMEAASL